MLKNIGLVVLFIIFVMLTGPACQSDPNAITPHQVDDSILKQVVRVKGKITMAIENPMGLGGMYMTLGDGEGEVDVRIQGDVWDALDKNEKARYREGKTVVVEGVLVRAGAVLVVVHGKYKLSSNTTSSNQ